MKLQERKKHEEENASGHLMLLFQTVMQLFLMVGKTMRESGQVSMNGVNLPKQKDLERYAKQVENILKENEELKSKLVQQKERITQLESSRENMSNSASAFDPTFAKELLQRLTTEEGKTANLELLFVEANRLNEELQRKMSTLARQQESSNGTTDRLQRQFESMSHSLALPRDEKLDLLHF